MRRHVDRALAAGVALAGLHACAGEPDPIARDLQSVQERIVPPGGRLTGFSGPRREGQAFRASWQIETEMSWSAYSSWVVAQLPEFHLGGQAADGVRLSRALEGDAYTLALRRLPAGNHGRIQATFEARPF